jgi:hypothetical protein
MTVAQLKTHVDNRFSRLDRRLRHRFGHVDARFAGIDSRLDSVDARLDSLIATIDRRFESFGDKLDSISGRFERNNEHTQTILSEHEERLKDFERAARTPTSGG